jgi:DNA-binding CsgD family transcriptional regulator
MSACPGVVLLGADGRIVSATAPAARLLSRARPRDEALSALRGLHARAASADPGQPVVAGLPLRDGGRVLLTGALAGTAVAVVVQVQDATSAPLDLAVFTAREREVVALVIQGLATKAIATLLEISPWTVTDHLRAIFAKSGVNSRGELLALALQRSQPAA